MVAMLGHIIPAPLAMPATVTLLPLMLKLDWRVFGNASVVIIAEAAREKPSGRSPAISSGTPALTFSTGKGTPMTPVDDTSISPFLSPSPFSMKDAMAQAAAYPSLPVHALALPLFTTTPL